MITLISENGPELLDKIKECLIMMSEDLAARPLGLNGIEISYE